MTEESSAAWAFDQAIILCRGLGLDITAAATIHHYNSTIVLLPAENVVVKLSEGARAERIQISQAICTWLADEHGFAAVRPAPGLPPATINGLSAGFWLYQQQPAHGAEPTSRDLARIVRQLHDLPAPPHPLTSWSPLASLASVLRTARADAALGTENREWLTRRVTDIQQALSELDWPLGHGLIHGDSWVGNLLAGHRNGTAYRLGDWDNVAIGPREVDLVPTWHASYRYGRGEQWRAEFSQLYGYDLEGWPGFALLMDMRDLVQLSGPLRRAEPGNVFAAALDQRFGDIQRGRRHTVWTAL